MSVMGVESSQIMSVMKTDGIGGEKGNGKTCLFQYFPHFPVVGQFFCYSNVVNTEHVQNMLDFCGWQGFKLISSTILQSESVVWPLGDLQTGMPGFAIYPLFKSRV